MNVQPAISSAVQSPRYKRKSKLKMRYGKNPITLANEIRRTTEKLELLRELEDTFLP